MLDDLNIIAGRDPRDALGIAAAQPTQASWLAQVKNTPERKPAIASLVVLGVGNSALAADLAKSWLRLPIPFEVVRTYDVPQFVGESTLVIASSYSGDSEEVLAAVEAAEAKGAQIAAIASGGQLVDIAQEKNYPLVQLPGHYQPRMALLLGLRALTKLLETYSVGETKHDELAGVADWLSDYVQGWLPEAAASENLAKQLALHASGKTVVIYSGSRMAPVARKWKICFNESAKNIAFFGELPEANHNDLVGWTSHPVDKSFAVFDLVSGFDYPQVLKRFGLADRLLSGHRPKAVPVELQGESVIAQMLWGCVLADFVAVYLAILNGVDPLQADITERFKQELSQ